MNRKTEEMLTQAIERLEAEAVTLSEENAILRRQYVTATMNEVTP